MTEFDFDFNFEEWTDIEPILQNDGPNPVVAIAYAKEYVKLMDLFRAVVVKHELSERVLDLTTSLLDLNAANYTVWQYRRECLKSLKSDLHDELDFMDSFSKDNPKNYQIWYHRRAIVELLGDASRELEFCTEVFEIDSKNYHAWAHRQWVLSTFNLWEKELAYIEEVIEEDIRNNSAWNQRWFYVHNGPEQITSEVLGREVAYAFAAIEKTKCNESPWNYVRGLTRFHPELVDEIKARCQALVDASEESNALALGLLADLREKEGTLEGLNKAEVLLVRLVTVDKIRSKSWIRRIDSLKASRSLLVSA